VVAEPRHRRLGVHRDPHEALRRDLLEGVHQRLADLAQGPDRRLPVLLAADVGGRDLQELLAADHLGHVRNGRQVHHPNHAPDLLRYARGPFAVDVEGVVRQLGREEQGTGVDLVDRQELDVQRGDDRVPPTAAS
jgi:hypothetical protein